jgi:WD40 repeat protein
MLFYPSGTTRSHPICEVVFASALRFSSDGNTLASIDTSVQVTLSDAETGRTLLDSIGSRVTSVAFSPDGTRFATVGWDGHLAFWDRATGEPKGDAKETKFRLFSVAFSADGRTVAAGGDSAFLLWDTATRRWLMRTDRQRDRIWSVAFSPDGRLVASGGNASFGLWDAKTGSQLIHPVITDPDPDYAIPADVAFSRDGKLLAYRQGGAGIILWEVSHRYATGGAFSGHRGLISPFAFDPDTKLLATGGRDGTVVLWDVASHEPVGRPFAGMGTEVRSLAFRPNGKTLAVLGDKRLFVWNTDAASWRDTACQLANRNLTHDEWSRFFGSAAAFRATCPVQNVDSVK